MAEVVEPSARGTRSSAPAELPTRPQGRARTTPGDYHAGHATATPPRKPVTPRMPVAIEDHDWTNSNTALNAGEIAHFRKHGYLVKRGLIDEPEAFRLAVDHLWQHVPKGLLDRDDPATWLSDPGEAWTDEDARRVGMLSHGGWKMRSRGEGGIGTEPFLVQRIANHPNILRVVRAFLGKPIKPVGRVRGIYAVFPKKPDAPPKLGPHADYHAAHISTMVLVHDTPPRCGGFTIWPGSHRILHPHWDTVHGAKIAEEKREGFADARDAVLRDITPVEFSGKAGDVIFWHGRMLHSAGINHSAETANPMVRLIVPCDYQIDGQTYVDDMEFGPGPNVQWWVDTRNFAEDERTTPDNIFHGWAI